MHTRSSNSELVEPLSEPERTLNRRLRRLNRRVPFERRDEQPRVVYLPILDINYFRHFLNILENYNPIDVEPMWAAGCVVALSPGSPITIPETANEFSIKANHLTLVKGNQFCGRIKTDPHKHIHEFLKMLRNCHGHNLSKGNIIKTLAFANNYSSNSDTDKIMARMNAMTMKMDVEYKEIQSRSNHSTPDCNDDDTPMSREE
ncbi:hypothetical protein Tco_0870305 [Tanacetum coccineum]